MNLPERDLYKLTLKQMRPDELKKQIQKKKRIIKIVQRNIRWNLRAIKEAEKELGKRPKSKSYKPGIYWSHTAYRFGSEWVEGEEELVIVDHEGFPWLWNHFGNEWHQFGRSFNSTRERCWEWISNI